MKLNNKFRNKTLFFQSASKSLLKEDFCLNINILQLCSFFSSQWIIIHNFRNAFEHVVKVSVHVYTHFLIKENNTHYKIMKKLLLESIRNNILLRFILQVPCL